MITVIVLYRVGRTLSLHATGPRDPVAAQVLCCTRSGPRPRPDGDRLVLWRRGRELSFSAASLLLAARGRSFGLRAWSEPRPLPREVPA